MPNPKRRHSKARRDKRRTHYKATAPSVGECPNCHEPKLLHRACPNCGYYNGRSIIIPKES
ncbi:MAG: 50S ribosomal protein L32 [Bacteroidota bacterium]